MRNQNKSFLEFSIEEQNELIIRTAALLKIAPILAEKDFWVSWLINTIFQVPESQHLIFKGGTSLSKCYGIISRFSEDIDLTIDRSFLIENPDENASNKKLQKFIKDADQAGSDFVQKIFKPALESTLSNELGAFNWSLDIDEDEPKNLRFYYPTPQKQDNKYIRQSVLIEIGVRGEITPSENQSVISYVEKEYQNILNHKKSVVKTLSPKRTFWEKTTILHAENHRPKDKVFGDRLSRHYYDIYQMIQNGIADEAAKDLDLLEIARSHKSRYFRSSWANYDTAYPPTLSIYPNDYLKQKLTEDYKQMQIMLFGNPPSFEEILASIRNFQEAINKVNTTSTSS